jgi:excinuclease UvrABC helicase subunit UvrB
VEISTEIPIKLNPVQILKGKTNDVADVDMKLVRQLTPDDLTKLIKMMISEMHTSAKQLDFELAAKIRDKVTEIKSLE